MPRRPYASHHPAQESSSVITDTSGILGEPLLVAKDYLTLQELMAQSDFQPLEQQLILFIIDCQLSCDYCLKAHSDSAASFLISEQDQQDIQQGKMLQDVHLRALQQFLQHLIKQKSQVVPKEIQEFLAAGYTQKNAMELITALSMKAISNYTWHIPQK